jgi:hypothetical protein
VAEASFSSLKTAGTTKKSSAPGKFIIRDPGPRTRIAPWHIPQLQAEMLCLGEDCQSCLFVSSSATKGAVVLELQRDDAYIQVSNRNPSAPTSFPRGALLCGGQKHPRCLVFCFPEFWDGWIFSASQGMLAHARYFKRTFVDTGREPHWDFADDMPGHEVSPSRTVPGMTLRK